MFKMETIKLKNNSVAGFVLTIIIVMNIIWELGFLKLVLCLRIGFGEIVVSKKQTNPNFQFYFFFQLP